jgi:hypothetical protein
MDLIRILFSRCLAFLRRRKLDEDLDEEEFRHERVVVLSYSLWQYCGAC